MSEVWIEKKAPSTEKEDKKQGLLYEKIINANTGDIEENGNGDTWQGPTSDYKFTEILDEAKADFPTLKQASIFLLSIPEDTRKRTGFDLSSAHLELIKKWFKKWFIKGEK